MKATVFSIKITSNKKPVLPWATGKLNVSTGKYKDRYAVRHLKPGNGGPPVSFDVTLGNNGKEYKFMFTGGPTDGKLNIDPSPDVSNPPDSWQAVADSEAGED